MNQEGSAYLYKDPIKASFSRLKKSVAYIIWKRKIKKYAADSNQFKLLDFGFGAGNFVRCIHSWFPNAEIHGMDVEPDLLENATREFPYLKVKNASELPWPYMTSSFDIVTCIQVIEHIENPEVFFQECSRVLRPNGLVILTTPNPDGIAAKVLKEKWQGIKEDHLSVRAPDKWRKELRAHNFEVIEDGTTALSGFRIGRIFPFSVFLNWIPMLIFGYFRWNRGESYNAIARKLPNKQ